MNAPLVLYYRCSNNKTHNKSRTEEAGWPLGRVLLPQRPAIHARLRCANQAASSGLPHKNLQYLPNRRCGICSLVRVRTCSFTHEGFTFSLLASSAASMISYPNTDESPVDGILRFIVVLSRSASALTGSSNRENRISHLCHAVECGIPIPSLKELSWTGDRTPRFPRAVSTRT